MDERGTGAGDPVVKDPNIGILSDRSIGGGESQALGQPKATFSFAHEGGDSALGAMDYCPEPDSCKVIVAGRHPIRVLHVDAEAGTISSVLNLRTRRRTGLNYSVVDVRWNPIKHDWLATAAANGSVVLWEDFQPDSDNILKDHKRAVNRLDWHPTQSSLLLSASQDGTMRLWDLRAYTRARGAPPGGGVTSTMIEPQSDSVRDARFSPFHANYIAAGFDNGTIQLWDTRKPNRYWRKITAHDRLVLSLTWHPTNRDLLASGGRDRMINIWNLKDPGTKPAHIIQTTNALGSLVWRDQHPHQIISSSSLMDNNIYIWDYTRPNVPYVSIGGHSDVVTGILPFPQGRSDHILSCSKDSSVQLHNISAAYRPWAHIRSAAISWNVYNSISVASDLVDRKEIYREFIAKPPPPPPKASPNPEPAEMPRTSLSDIYRATFQRRIPESPEPKKPDRPLPTRLQQPRRKLPPFAVGCFGDFLHSASSDSFHPETFLRLADGYLYLPDDKAVVLHPDRFSPAAIRAYVSSMFLHNEQLCAELRRPALAAIWRLLAVIYTDQVVAHFDVPQPYTGAEPAHARSPEKTANEQSLAPESTLEPFSHRLPLLSSIPPMLHGIPHLGGRSSDDEDSDDDYATSRFASFEPFSRPLDDFPAPREHPRDGPGSAHAPIRRLQGASVKQDAELRLNLLPSLPELLEYYADHGDVQSCCTIALALGPKILAGIRTPVILAWFSSYLELLQRMQAWTAAGRLIHSAPWDQIKNISKTSTSVHIGCGQCKKILMTYDPGHRCIKCHRALTHCSICERPVSGLFVWCQGCGHGGHLNHMKDWFSAHTLCSSGCNHQCSLFN